MKTSFLKRADLLRSIPVFILLFSFGAVGYYAIEVAFRGHSHWSMALCGGLCFCLLFLANRKLCRVPLLLRAFTGALIITGVELIAGCILNIWLGWGIWNYSRLPLNLWGQITPLFSALWFLLSIPVCILCTLSDRFLFKARPIKKAE